MVVRRKCLTAVPAPNSEGTVAPINQVAKICGVIRAEISHYPREPV
jgi:hypothetical protein